MGKDFRSKTIQKMFKITSSKFFGFLKLKSFSISDVLI
jgi:hypothetical protein